MSHALPREWFGTSIRNDGLRREKSRPRIWSIAAYLGAITLPLAALLFFFWQGVQVIRIGYEIDQLSREHQGLQNERNRLTMELSSLESLVTVEKLAERDLGMVFPALDQVVVVRESPVRAAPAAATPPDEPSVGSDLLAAFRKIAAGR
jgi:cell division protein FtsL